VSNGIFKSDPFLLREESQIEFGRTLLHNILVKRTGLTGKPKTINLHVPPPPEEQASRPRPPSDALKQKYLDSRKFRDVIDPDAPIERRQKLERILRQFTMVARGELTARRLRNVTIDGVEKPKFLTHEEARAECKDPETLDGRLRIATIGFRVKVSKIPGEAFLSDDLCLLAGMPEPPQEIGGVPDMTGIEQLGRTTLAPNAKKERWDETISSHICKAIARGSQIVVVPEFALPPKIEGTDLENALQRCCEDASAACRKEHFIFAGSRHEGGYNRGFVLHVAEDKTEAKTDWHYKIASARSLGENILGPRTNAYAAYEADVVVNGSSHSFLVTVAICYDTFDPSTFLSLVVNSVAWNGQETDRIILVPSFNPSSEFVEMLRDLSFLTGSIVVYVNALHGDARMFIAGFSIGDLLDQASGNAIAQIKAFMEETRTELKLQKKKKQDAQAKGNLKELNEANQRRGVLNERIRRLEPLLDGIEALHLNGGLKHLITVENCPACAGKSHDDDYACASDILYYNIDARLLKFLTLFRERYYDDSFLPEPLQRAQLEQLLAILKKRWQQEDDVRRSPPENEDE
jgi:hypothetical protein